MNTATVDTRIRTFMLILSGFALASTTAELWLQDHTQTPLQWIPWGLCALGLISLLAAFVRPGRATYLALRWSMVVVALGGMVGITIHLLENIEFQRDINANAQFGNYIIAALKGAAPLLAPGALTFAALLSIAAVYAHPLLTSKEAPARAAQPIPRSSASPQTPQDPRTVS